MMLGLREVSINIVDKLKPVSDALTAYGVRVRSLPKKPRQRGTQEAEYVRVLVPQVKGVQRNQEGVQEVNILVVIRVSLGKLFAEMSDEKDVLDWAVDQIINNLLGFIPFTDKTVSRRSLWFEGYDLLQPNNGTWEAELRFQCTKLLEYEVETFDEDDRVESVELYASETLSELDAILFAKVP